MSHISLDFDWEAPVPQVFTRTDHRCFWPSDRLYHPLLFATRYARDLKMLLQGLPPELAPLLRERFKPTRGPLIWHVPPALPLSMRQPYDEEALGKHTDLWVRSEVCVIGGMIERLFNTPEGTVGGLTHNYLMLMQMLRLRQLWAEVQRRQWTEDPLVIFQRALG
jgi:hypothetical protein